MRAVLLLALACHVERPYPPPSADDLLAHLRAQERHVRTLRARARVERPGGVHATVMLLVAPGKLRFDAMSPVDTPLATLVADGASFALLDDRAGRFLRGPADPCNVARLVPLALAPDDVARVLVGSTPILDGEPPTVRWDGRAAEEVVELHANSGRTQTVRLRGPRNAWRLASSEIRDPAGALLLRVAPSEWRSVSGVDLPGAIDVTTADDSLRLEYREQAPNVPIADGAFHLDPPPGTPVEDVRCP